MVEASKFNNLAHLREVIQNKRLLPSDIPMNRLKLHKISTMDDELEEILADRGVGQLLGGPQLLQTFFDDVPFSSFPRVVVEWLEDGTSKPPPSVYRDIGSDDPIARARINFLAQVLQKRPSSASAPSSFRSR